MTWDPRSAKPTYMGPYDLESLNTEEGVQALLESHFALATKLVRAMRGGVIPPTVYLYCPLDPISGEAKPGTYMTYCDPVHFDTQENKAAFSLVARLGATMGQAVAACAMTEVWVALRDTLGKTGDEIRKMNETAPSEEPDRKEAILLVLLLKSGRSIARLCEIKRYPPAGATLSILDQGGDSELIAGLFNDILKPIDLAAVISTADVDPYRGVGEALRRIEYEADRRGKS